MDTVGGNSKAFDTRELFFLVAKFLEASPCHEAAKVLKRELAQNGLLPTRKNWLGEEKQISYREMESRTGRAQSTTLPNLCSKLLFLLEKHSNPRIPGLCSLLGSAVTAPVSSLDNNATGRTVLRTHVNQTELLVGFKKQPFANFCQLTCARQLSSSVSQRSFCGPLFYQGLKKHCSVLGHLAPVFCVLFDHTGERIITGADDKLIKIWASRTGQLLATLRGHSAEVCDLSLSYDNAMIASGSLDKSVRVWCAQTSAPLAVLIGHQSQVTSVQFSPSPSEEHRYLASTGKDGILCFWLWLPESNTFSSSPVKFMEKNKMGDQTLCSNFSPGGKYFVTGGTDKFLRVYVCIPGPPVLMAEVLAHSDRIMTVQFGHTGEGLLATGSCDGTAGIWRLTEDGWKNSSVLKLTDEEMSILEYKARKSGKNVRTQVTMLGWEKTDRFLVTAVTLDYQLRVWCTRTGTLLRKLQGHNGEVFVLEPHPLDSRILLTAGHDGLVILWDMLAGIRLTSFKLEDQEDGSVVRCIFDCKFSPDGTMCAAADIHGYLTLFGFGSSEAYKHPTQQFFHTDYHPLIHDRHHYVVDESTQLPPHLLPPPYLVNIDGNPHPTHHQEAIVRLFRPAKQAGPDPSDEEAEDYDEYMTHRTSKVKHREFASVFGAEGASSQQSLDKNKEPTDRSDGLTDRSSGSGGVQASETQSMGVTGDSSLSGNNDNLLQVNAGSVDVRNDLSQDVTTENSSPHNGNGPTSDENTTGSRVLESCASSPESRHVRVCDERSAGGSETSARAGPDGGDQQAVVKAVDESTGEAVEHMSNETVKSVDSDDVMEGMASDAVECVAGDVVERVSEEAGDAVERVPGEAGDAVERVPEEAGDAVESVPGEAGDAVERVPEEAGDAVERVPEEAGDAVERVPEEAGDAVERVPGEAGNAVERVPEEAGDAVERVAGDAVERVPGDAGDPGRDDVQAMFSSLVYSLGLGEVETKDAISLWQNRTIIKPLDSAHLCSYLARRQQLYEEEEAQHQKMLERGKEVASPAQIPTFASLSPRGRSLRSGRTILSSVASESTTTTLESSDASEGVSLMDGWEESSTDSGDISDWTAEVTSVPLGRKRTRRQRRLLTMSDEESDEDSKVEEETMSPGPAQDGLSDKTSPVVRSKGKKSKRGQSSSREVGPEAYALYQPPDWIMQTSPKLSPYLPQVGDIVVYCHQGHQLYLKDVKKQNIYPCKNLKPPWEKYSLLPQEFCQVTNVRFCVGPPTLCSITLALLSSAVCPVKGGASSSRNEKITFSFKYHDMDGVLDFLILESVFKSSTQKTWESGENFQSLIDGSYWKGTVLERVPFSEELPQSYWQCYRVQWEDGVEDQLSPWDMHSLDSDLSVYIREMMTTPAALLEQEWGGVNERERILSGLDKVLELDEAHMFREPVSLAEVPNYCTAVAFPTDLGTIKQRMANHHYRRKMALLWEVVQMWRNAVSFNLKDSLIVKHCRITVHMLWKFISSPDVSDPITCYEAHPVGEVGREVVVTPPQVEFTSAETLFPVQTAPPPDPAAQTTNTASWLPEAEKLVTTLSDHPSSTLFLHPVDIDTYKDYLQIIHTPMDLSTALSKLQSGHYSVPKDFIADLELIFKNAKTYNRKGTLVYKMATDLQAFFEPLVLDFLKAFSGTCLVYGTRGALGKVALSCSSISEPDRDSVTSSDLIPVRTSRRLRAKQRRSQSSDSELEVNGDNVSPPPPKMCTVVGRVTRTRSGAADKYGGYGLRTRSHSQAMMEVAESDDSEENSVTSRKSEEEEAYLQELHEESEESHTSVLSQRKRLRRSTRHSPRKRAKIVESDDSDEEIVLNRSRSGRVVKPILKFS